MTLFLGIDTGGTYTDAVLYDESAPAPGIVAKAKALTTRHDLSSGVGAAIDAVLAASGAEPGRIGLVSLSTTLATNALVEGQGGRICLVLIGFDEGALGRAGLADALGPDPVAFVAGGHTPSGARQAPLDSAALAAAAARHGPDVDAFAVVAYFGTRDPADEIAARTLIAATADRPVTCGHELAAALGGPKRAVTTVLNARLIGMIAGLIAACEATLAARRIAAPLMLVRGDGSLVSADFARTRPIETILSGPAASLVGAAHLAGCRDAVVSDIGGTTTDIAVLRDGRPRLSPEGAVVGPHRTMVEAVDMTTHGLGGDSEIAVDDQSLRPRLIVGPRRALPIALIAAESPGAVHAALDAQLGRPSPGPHDARFALRGSGTATGLRDADRALLDCLTGTPVPLGDLLRSRMQAAALRRLAARGLARIAAFTPTDAAHVLGRHDAWDARAAEKAATLMARRRDAAGRPVAPDAQAFAEMTLATLVRRSAEVLLEAALAQDGFEGAGLAATPLARAALGGHRGAARVSLGLDLPLIGLGAAAPLYYPAIARALGTDPVIPEHADVANAIGAVVGRVRLTVEATLTQPAEGRFRIHLPDGVADHLSLDAALADARARLDSLARARAAEAGAATPDLAEDWAPVAATVEGREIFVEGRLAVTASGRPRIADDALAGGARSPRIR